MLGIGVYLGSSAATAFSSSRVMVTGSVTCAHISTSTYVTTSHRIAYRELHKEVALLRREVVLGHALALDPHHVARLRHVLA